MAPAQDQTGCKPGGGCKNKKPPHKPAAPRGAIIRHPRHTTAERISTAGRSNTETFMGLPWLFITAPKGRGKRKEEEARRKEGSDYVLAWLGALAILVWRYGGVGLLVDRRPPSDEFLKTTWDQTGLD